MQWAVGSEGHCKARMKMINNCHSGEHLGVWLQVGCDIVEDYA